MKKIKTVKWDIVDQLQSEADIAAYFEAALEEAGNDSAFITKVLGDIARARGMTKIAQKTGLTRTALYAALSENGNPAFSTVLKVINALGLRLHVSGAL